MIKIDSFKSFLVFNEYSLPKNSLKVEEKNECLVLSMYKECDLKKEWIRFLEIICESNQYKQLFFDLRGNNLNTWFVKRLIASVDSMSRLEMISIDLRESLIPFKPARDCILYFHSKFYPSEKIIISMSKRKVNAPDSIDLSCGKILVSCTIKGMKSLNFGKSKHICVKIPEDEFAHSRALKKLRDLIKIKDSPFNANFSRNGRIFIKLVRKYTPDFNLEINLINNPSHQSEFLINFPYHSFTVILFEDYFNIQKQIFRNEAPGSTLYLKSKDQIIYSLTILSQSKRANSLRSALPPISYETFKSVGEYSASSFTEEQVLIRQIIPHFCSIHCKMKLHFIKKINIEGIENQQELSILTIGKKYPKEEIYKPECETIDEESKLKNIYINFQNNDFIKRVLEKITSELKTPIISSFTMKLVIHPFGLSPSRDLYGTLVLLDQIKIKESFESSRKEILESLKSEQIHEMAISKVEIKQNDRMKFHEFDFSFAIMIRSTKHIKISGNSEQIAYVFHNLILGMQQVRSHKTFKDLTFTIQNYGVINFGRKDISLIGNRRVIALRLQNLKGFSQVVQNKLLKASRLVSIQKYQEKISNRYYDYDWVCDCPRCTQWNQPLGKFKDALYIYNY